MAKNKEKCSWCEKQLDSEEKESPQLSKDKEIICDDWHDGIICKECSKIHLLVQQQNGGNGVPPTTEVRGIPPTTL